MNLNEKPGAIILMSGGMDSTVASAIRAEQYTLFGLTLAYGQRHAKEIEYAKHWGKRYCQTYTTWEIPYPGDNPLLEQGTSEPPREATPEGTVAPTWLPGRNLLFLAYAGIYAQQMGLKRVIIGVNQVDFSGYPDCRHDFITKMEDALNSAMGVYEKAHPQWIHIDTPLLSMPKEEIIRQGSFRGVDFSKTWSCYRGEGTPCGVCDSCRIRDKAMRAVLG